MSGADLRWLIGGEEACPEVRKQMFLLEEAPGTATLQDAEHTQMVQLHWWEEFS